MAIACTLLLLLAVNTGLTAQLLDHAVLSNGGGAFSNGSVFVEQTVGQVVVGTTQNGTRQLTQGFEQPGEVLILIQMTTWLEGPFDVNSGLMRDDLRTTWLPLIEPYTDLGYDHIHSGGETTTPSVLAYSSGGGAVVDWVFLELRDKNDPTLVLATRSALIRRDGMITDVDGVSPVRFKAPSNSYYVAVHHRNHLAAMTSNTIGLSRTPEQFALGEGAAAVYGPEGMKLVAGQHMLWAGDVTGNGVIKYTGSGNDRDPILYIIGGTVATNTASGYLQEDVNMDGTVRYTGAGNDRDRILVNIGGTVATNTRTEQLP